MNPIKIETAIFEQWIADDGYEIGTAEKSDLANYMGPHKEAYAANGGKIIGYRGHSQSRIIDIVGGRPQLFTDFAHIKNDDEIVIFANQYGLLLPNETTYVPAGSHPRDYECTPGEKISFWKKQIRDMKLALQIWQWCEQKNVETLRHIISKQKDYILYKYSFTDPKFDGWSKIREETTYGSGLSFDQLTSGSVVLQASFFVQRIINEHTKQFPVEPCLVFDRKGNLKQHHHPSSLVSLMWFQFFRYVTGEQKIQQCPVCEDWYDVGDENGEIRWNNRCPICSNRLRVQKASVKKRFDEGMPIDEIIQRSRKAQPDNIREWIAEFDKQKGGSPK